jgi:hypothetical protein
MILLATRNRFRVKRRPRVTAPHYFRAVFMRNAAAAPLILFVIIILWTHRPRLCRSVMGPLY